MVTPRSRVGPADPVEHQGLVDREAPHVVQQARQGQVGVRARGLGQLRALERVGQLGDALGAVVARGGVRHGVEQAPGHAGRLARISTWSILAPR